MRSVPVDLGKTPRIAMQKTDPISAGLILLKSTLQGECFLATRFKYFVNVLGSVRYRTTRFNVLEYR